MKRAAPPVDALEGARALVEDLKRAHGDLVERAAKADHAAKVLERSLHKAEKHRDALERRASFRLTK